jgi:hypothetical protein
LHLVEREKENSSASINCPLYPQTKLKKSTLSCFCEAEFTCLPISLGKAKPKIGAPVTLKKGRGKGNACWGWGQGEGRRNQDVSRHCLSLLRERLILVDLILFVNSNLSINTYHR